MRSSSVGVVGGGQSLGLHGLIGGICTMSILSIGISCSVILHVARAIWFGAGLSSVLVDGGVL